MYVYLKHAKEQVVETAGIELGSRLRQLFGDRVLGPDKPAVARVKTLHIRKLVLKLEPSLSGEQVRQCLRYAHNEMAKDKKIRHPARVLRCRPVVGGGVKGVKELRS